MSFLSCLICCNSVNTFCFNFLSSYFSQVNRSILWEELKCRAPNTSRLLSLEHREAKNSLHSSPLGSEGYRETLNIQQVNWYKEKSLSPYTHTQDILSVSHCTKGYCAVWRAVAGDNILWQKKLIHLNYQNGFIALACVCVCVEVFIVNALRW